MPPHSLTGKSSKIKDTKKTIFIGLGHLKSRGFNHSMMGSNVTLILPDRADFEL